MTEGRPKQKKPQEPTIVDIATNRWGEAKPAHAAVAAVAALGVVGGMVAIQTGDNSIRDAAEAIAKKREITRLSKEKAILDLKSAELQKQIDAARAAYEALAVKRQARIESKKKKAPPPAETASGN